MVEGAGGFRGAVDTQPVLFWAARVRGATAGFRKLRSSTFKYIYIFGPKFSFLPQIVNKLNSMNFSRIL
jgi:hypothetical protein